MPYGLMHLTPARLKEECIMRCGKCLNKRDEKVIRDFCGDLNESKTCLAIMQHCDTDKFRPLVNYLKKNSERTDPKNVELLAWLIDFPGRPWDIGKKYQDITNDEAAGLENEGPTATEAASSQPTAGSGIMTGISAIPKNPIIPTQSDSLNEQKTAVTKSIEAGNQIKRGKSTKKLTATVILSLALVTGGAWWWKEQDRLPDLSGGCMYWKEDHYEPIACNEKIPNAMIIALDTIKLKNFRKLTRPDTITYGSIGKVWYSKIDGNLEFYTSGGEHPVVFDRRLKPITIYIIDKYILSGMIIK